ncbi:MAG: Jag N-terminal domain-containing protein [Candidatus Omnitrophota bacterium]
MEKDKNLEEIEIEAGNVKEAIKIAIEKLNVPKEFLEIKILSEGQGGLFGMEGVKPAKIKVRVLKKDTPPE